MTVTPNWFEDGKNILALGGGVLLLVTQVVQFWRQNVVARRVGKLHEIVADNDKEILDEISIAQQTLDKVVASVSAARDRRKNAPDATIPTWANGGAGRRASDAPSVRG